MPSSLISSLTLFRAGVGAALALSLAPLRAADPVPAAPAPAPAAVESGDLTQWPVGCSPAEVGKRVAERFVPRKFTYETSEVRRRTIIYPEVCTWYGALAVAQLTRDTDLQSRLVAKGAFLLTPEGAAHLPRRAHVDDSVFGALPLEIYLQTKDRRHLELGLSFADKQWETPSADGVTAEARYWIDDMYMIPAVQVQAFRATGERKYLDRAALAMAAYLDRLQKPNGLFFHAPDSPFFWGRGNGWFAAGMAELLRDLPADHPQHTRILDGYRKMMDALRQTQGGDGLWRQLIDNPKSWPETSCTGMFGFAIITGVKGGWLDAKVYGPVARRAWLGLVKHIGPEAEVAEVCVGTNKGFSVEYYIDRPRRTGDLHGQAPILWCASALLR